MSHVKQKGFTLIELLLAMTFISVLLLAIAMTILQISAIYNRGMTLKEVNQSGRAISSDVQKAITSSALFPVTNPGSRFIQQGNWGGRLCLSQYSYIWNYGTSVTPNLNIYTPASTTRIRFVKVPDLTARYCTTPLPNITAAGAVELLSAGDHDIAIHNVSVTTSTTATDILTGQQLYTVTFVIGTSNATALDSYNSTTNPKPAYYNGLISGCKPPNISGSDPIYCVVQTFSFVARAGNVQ